MKNPLQTACQLLSVLVLSTAGVAAFANTPASAEPSFPVLDSSYLKTGAFVVPANVRRVTPGLNKDQVRLELGNPHFSEGIFGVKEWDYAFNFYTGKGDEYVTCQYKARFNNEHKVVSTHWKGPDCASYLQPAVVSRAAPVAAVAAPVAVAVLPLAPVARRRVVLSADGLFAFGKSGIADLAAPGVEKLNALVAELKQDTVAVSSIMVTGHTDRIGPDTANMALSQARAETVRSYLVKGGVDGRLIRAQGVGESRPVAQCTGEKVTPQLVACLQPNRRVEIDLAGER